MGGHAAGSFSVFGGAGAIFLGILGAMYAGTAEGSVTLDAVVDVVVAAAAERVGAPEPVRVVSVTSPEPPASEPLRPPPEAPLPAGQDVTEEAALMLDAEREIVDAQTGVRLGRVTFEPEPEVVAVTPVPVAPPEREARPREARARRAPRRPAAPVPRLHPNPGMHVIATARRMNANGVTVSGSCYTYIAEVFTRAGHDGWRNRRVVYQGNRNGPYANLDQVRPGDWLYIVNHPDRTPVGTHSVLFVGWEDRALGYARVIEHGGWGGPRVGTERGYDVSRTYRITRPILRGE